MASNKPNLAINAIKINLNIDPLHCSSRRVKYIAPVVMHHEKHIMTRTDTDACCDFSGSKSDNSAKEEEYCC